MKINIKKARYAIVVSIIALVAFGVMGNALCRYRTKYHEYRDQYNKCHAQYKKCNAQYKKCNAQYKKCNAQANRDKKIATSMHYVLSCYGDPYIVDFKEIVEHPKVSIILPVYNKGWCVEAALRSLQRQTLKEIEIVCVDDGSTDDSIEKIKNYQQHDTRIKLVENGENRGTLYTRAHGILEATGDYIMFLDPDDLYATNDIVEVVYNKCIENDVDVVCFGGYVSRKDSLHEHKFCHDIEFGKIYDDKDKIFTNIYRFCWNKCIKKECCFKMLNVISGDVLEKHICLLEDQIFVHALSLCISKYIHTGHNGYFYNKNEWSITMESFVGISFDRADKRASDVCIVFNELLALSPHMQDFLLNHIRNLTKNRDVFAPYTDDQLQQFYDIYMQINFDDEHKAKLSQHLKDGIEEMRKLRDGDQQN